MRNSNNKIITMIIMMMMMLVITKAKFDVNRTDIYNAHTEKYLFIDCLSDLRISRLVNWIKCALSCHIALPFKFTTPHNNTKSQFTDTHTNIHHTGCLYAAIPISHHTHTMHAMRFRLAKFYTLNSLETEDKLLWNDYTSREILMIWQTRRERIVNFVLMQ